GDPKSYITPDGIADFTTIRLEQQSTDRVRASGIKGRAATDQYKVSISYSAGFKAVGTLAYSWPDAYKKARAADKILRQRMERLGLKLDAIHSEFVGVNGCHGEMSGEPDAEIAEVVLRIGARAMEKAPVERFLKEIIPIALNGPPSVTGLSAGRSKVDEIIAYWPALILKTAVAPQVDVVSV
ncbi:MAG TPA: acyclic terpene utilization AtuA family protein, partial [Candidatus Angelobacter sp.]|nr:acyclic terpene utilization AtuA family protein [Candidatus Angelobacter sp.]